MVFTGLPISITGKEDGCIFRGKKKYHRLILPTPTLIDPPHHYLQGQKSTTSLFARSQTPKGKKTKNPKKRSREVNRQAKREQYKVRRSLFTIQGKSAFLYAGIIANNKHCYHHHSKPVGSLQTAQHCKCTNCAQTTSIQSNIQMMAKILHSRTTFIPSALRLVLRGELI